MLSWHPFCACAPPLPLPLTTSFSFLGLCLFLCLHLSSCPYPLVGFHVLFVHQCLSSAARMAITCPLLWWLIVMLFMWHYCRQTAIGECCVGWPYGASFPQCCCCRQLVIVVVLAYDAAESSAVAFLPTSTAVAIARLLRKRMYSPVINEGPHFADVPPLDLGACCNVSKGWRLFLTLLLLVVVPLSLSLLS